MNILNDSDISLEGRSGMSKNHDLLKIVFTTKAPVTQNYFLERLTPTWHVRKTGYGQGWTCNFGTIMPEAHISPNLFLERHTPVNKIEKGTAVGIGRVIPVGKMQMHYQLMPDCWTSQIRSKYVCTVCSASISFSVRLIIGRNTRQKCLSNLKVLEHLSRPNLSIKFVNRL